MKSINGKRYGPAKVFIKAGLLLVVLIISFATASGQQADVPFENQRTSKVRPTFRERLFYGGNLGLQFGTFTDIQVSPVIGLWVLPRIGVAVGPNFRYYKDPFNSTVIYGGKSYIEYLFLQDIHNIIPLGIHAGLFLHFEDEVLSLESGVFRDPASTGRFTTNTLLAGGGVRQPLGQRSSLNLTFLWALNDSGYGIYSNPEIRISVIF